MRAKWHGFLLLFFWMTLFYESRCYCSVRDLEAYTSGSLTYRSSGYSYYKSGKYGGYDNNERCTVLFEASYEGDVIKIEVVDTDMDGRHSGYCKDIVILYDGPSEESPILKKFCGSETPTVESTSSKVLLVFETDGRDSRNSRGFKLEYSSIDRGGFEAYMDSSSAVSSGAIAAAVIPSVIIYGILMVVVYKRCKYAQRVRRNLAATGHTPDDLRVAMATMIEQANRGQLNIPRRGQDGIQEGLVNLMDQNAANRNSSSARGGGRSGRVRHPAGDVRTTAHSGNASQNRSLPVRDGDTTVPFLGYGGADGTDQNNGHYSQPSNNNITTNNNTAVNLNYPNYPGYPPDPTGVYYAGNVDERGMMYPADGGPPYYPGSMHPPYHANLSHLDVDDDHRSRSSGRRSPHSGSGRNSPRHSPSHSHTGHRSRASSAGHRSTHLPNRHATGHHHSLNQLNAERGTITYYGMVDGAGSGSGDMHSVTDSTDVPGSDPMNYDPPSFDELQLPPPSYEEAATGKYSPYHES